MATKFAESITNGNAALTKRANVLETIPPPPALRAAGAPAAGLVRAVLMLTTSPLCPSDRSQ